LIRTYPQSDLDNVFKTARSGIDQDMRRRAPQPVLTGQLYRAGLRAWHMQSLSLGAIGLCIALWIRAKTVDQEERGNAERRAIFVGLWPPTIWLIGESLDRVS
jgi:hypothetical protein